MTTKHATGRAPAANEYATPAELAGRWHTTEPGLKQQRYNGTGPKFVKVGRRVLYRWTDIHEFESQNTHTRTDEIASA